MLFQLKFTTRNLERLAAKAEKEQKTQQAKVKKVNYALVYGKFVFMKNK
jgi:hypothetical protein